MVYVIRFPRTNHDAVMNTLVSEGFRIAEVGNDTTAWVLSPPGYDAPALLDTLVSDYVPATIQDVTWYSWRRPRAYGR